LLPFVLATFALGALVPMVNNVAHFGGLLMGFLLGFGLSAGDRSFLVAGAGVDDDTAKAAALATVSSAERAAGMIALVVSVVGFAATTAYALEPRLSPRFHAVMGLRAAHDASVAHADALKGAPLAAARAHAEAAAALAPDDGTTGALVARLAALDGHDDVARARMGRAFRTWLPESGDRNAAFEAAATELALLEPDDEMPFADGFTTRLLCDAALDDDGVNQPSHNLLNSCAWLLLRARERPVRDPVAALPLARAAWETSKKERAEIVHTYACALADNGAAAEGLALLEQLSLAEHGAALAPAFLARERARLARLADEQARARRPAADAATPSSPAASQTPDLPALPALPGGDAAEGCAIDHDCADAAVDDPATAPSTTTIAPTTTAPTTTAPTTTAPTTTAPTTTAPTTTAPTTTASTTIAPTTTAPTTTASTTTAPTTTAPTTAPTGSESRSNEQKR
jgi:hypothetical protein